MLNYDVANASTVMLSSSTSTKVATLLQHSGSLSVQPAATTTYTITATNSVGSVTATADVTVGPAIIIPGVILTVPQTKEFTVITSESGSVSSDHVVGPKMITGDASTNKTYWAYFSFNISTIAGREVTKAELVYSPSSINGHPWPNLVSLGIYQVNHGARPLQPGDFTFAGPTIADGITQIQTVVPLDVTSQVQTSVSSGAPRFQVRLNFVKMNDSNGQADNISWTSSTPKLRVTYR